MTESRYSAQAVSNHLFGDPEIIIFRDIFIDEAGTWEPHEIVQRERWGYELLSDDTEVMADADDVLRQMGWRTIPDDSINGGWDPTDFGAVAVVEPTH